MTDKERAGKIAKGYVAIIGLLSDVAKQHGYAMGIHGTLGRDLDLICVPWVEDVSAPKELIKAMAILTGGYVPSQFEEAEGKLVDNPVMRPHGRQGWVITLGGGTYLDVSVMPKLQKLSAVMSKGEPISIVV